MADETGSLLCIMEPTRLFTAQATEAITAGAFVKAASGDDVVNSTVTSYATSDIKVAECNGATDYTLAIGVAIEAASSSDYITVAQDGIYIYQGNSITAGAPIIVASAANKPYTVNDAAKTTAEIPYICGRALTGTSADNKYAIVSLNF